MLCLAPPNGKTEHSTKSSGGSLQSTSKGLSKLRMLKVACLQGQNVINKKRQSHRLLKHTTRECLVITHFSLRAKGAPNFY